MIKGRPTPFALLALWGLLPLSAYAANCYSIKDPDERNACLGGVKVERSYCYRIQAPDERADCLAGANADRSRCYQIKDPDQRSACLARTKK